MWMTDVFNSFKQSFIDLSPSLLDGLTISVLVTFISVLAVIILGFVLCMMLLSKSKLLHAAAKVHIFCIRGTPFMVQLYIVFFGIPQLCTNLGFELRFSAFMASVITCSINGSAYMADVFRTSIEAVDHGQIEAAKSLNVSKFYIMSNVILPQALRTCISSIGNQLIITFKDTSICSAIALCDIVYMGKLYIGRTMRPFMTYIVISVFYIVVISLVSILIRYIEGRLSFGIKDSDKKC